MKCIILAGGKGTRLMEHTNIIPKPMLTVGGIPLLRHVMNIYIQQGVNDFLVPTGYKGDAIIAYFLALGPQDFFKHPSGEGLVFQFPTYQVHVVDTGEDTLTGGRLRRIRHLLQPNAPFYFTYGDGVGNVNLKALGEQFFPLESTLATLTVVHPEGRFGRAVLKGDRIVEFGEKVENETDWINGGFAILTPSILSLIPSDATNLEKDILPFIAKIGLMSYHKHIGFWKCVDTNRDLLDLTEIYAKEGDRAWLKLS
jgi:glucose-1-phosphate cytidylyltransferase